MKKIAFSCAFAFAAALLAPSCVKSVEASSSRQEVTIHAAVPAEGSRIALTDNGDGLHLAWEAGDGLRVISGSQSEAFAIKEGFTDHEASFTGAEVTGDSFDIMYPATFASIEEAEASDFRYQVQNGNGSTDKQVRNTASPAGPSLIAQRSDNRLHKNAHQWWQYPEITQRVWVGTQRCKDARDVGRL